MKAIWNNKIIAESDKTILIEGNHYFPPNSINKEFLIKSNITTMCSWKGKANYFSIKVNGKLNKDCAWYYPDPLEEAKQIKEYVAFWKGVELKN
ncbi:MAG: DUF427 domain-containing protein [Nitrososphaeraceae archaeon]